MIRRPILRRELADRDIADIVTYYAGEAGLQVAMRFVDALEGTIGRIGRRPAIGSLGFADNVRIPGLRCCPVTASPDLVFYVDHGDHVAMWRVLHERRDIPAALRGDG